MEKYSDCCLNRKANHPSETVHGHLQDEVTGERGIPLKQFDTGAVRGTDADCERWDLITPVGLRRVAITYAEGAKKYGARNWLKGIPASDLINHAIRHIYMWLGGDMSEDHLAHAAWNLLAVMHFEDTKPDMIDCGPTTATAAEVPVAGR